MAVNSVITLATGCSMSLGISFAALISWKIINLLKIQQPVKLVKNKCKYGSLNNSELFQGLVWLY